MSLRALLLDVDGTVADTERYGHRPAFNRAFRKLGLDFRWGPKLYRRLLEQQGGRERLLHYIEHYQPDLKEHAAAVRADRQRWVKKVHRLKSHYFSRYLQKGRVPLRPGVARLLREAHEIGVKVALVSNASRASLEPILRYGLGAELASQIDTIVSGEDVLHKKPAPDSYLLALSRLGVRAEECIALEDSCMGLRAAVAAGIPTVVTLNANTEAEDFSSAVLVLENLGEPEAPSRAIRGELDSGCLSIAHLERLLPHLKSAA